MYLGRDPVTGRQQTRTHTYEAKGVKAARVKAAELERQARTSSGARLTLGEAADAWFEHWRTSKEPSPSPTTVREYRRRLDADVKPTRLWSTPVERLGTAEVERFYKHLHDERGFSPASVRRVHAVLRQVFDYLIPRGHIAANPCEHAWLPSGDERPMRIPSDAELEAILLAADKRDFTRGVCFLTAAGTAMRRGELVGLRWSRVDLTSGVVVVDTASVMGGQLKGTKSGSKGRLVMLPAVVEALRRLRAKQEGMLAAGRLGRPDDWFCFATVPPFDRPVREDAVTAWFRQACKDAGVEGVRLHDLRHWAVSHALASGVAPTDVQAMSRHLSLKTMLDVYGHAVSDAARRATAVLPLPKVELGRGV